MKSNRTAAMAVIEGRIPSAVVGNNKRLVRDEGVLRGMLHGSAVVVKSGNKLILRHYGHKRAITRMAMASFLDLLGVDGRVSFAEGKFTAIINNREYVGDDQIEVSL